MGSNTGDGGWPVLPPPDRTTQMVPTNAHFFFLGDGVNSQSPHPQPEANHEFGSSILVCCRKRKGRFMDVEPPSMELKELPSAKVDEKELV